MSKVTVLINNNDNSIIGVCRDSEKLGLYIANELFRGTLVYAKCPERSKLEQVEMFLADYEKDKTALSQIPVTLVPTHDSIQSCFDYLKYFNADEFVYSAKIHNYKIGVSILMQNDFNLKANDSFSIYIDSNAFLLKRKPACTFCRISDPIKLEKVGNSFVCNTCLRNIGRMETEK